ncbi:cytochrome c [Methylotenera sp.]|uniref:c-type cytochrome n=2 Tax=Methylotenera sp. TaxID=2051956 RepID=UPI0027205B90|nr:c-type cytochrome [Methylotenera sp.]MDO9204884.1 c-type cytochrome [Methylotenera sp.]MDO9394536.1 c-type cytochrome [Methylotenera sp.]MDP1523781.1 c-type cytochrome [Methylotenera sp.]MDP2070211.1 c-type cytochrome [Methylotenera sp.]MDP2231950.1 c-type cytochrome [Methylotenera sp.]
MQFHHLMRLNSVSVNLTGLMFSVLFSVSAQAAADKPAAPADKTLQTVNTVCAACHGADGNSAITLNPKLAGQHPEYLVKQLAEFKSGKRANAVMTGMAAMLSDAEMKDVATYFANQKLTLGVAKTNGAGSLGEKIYRGGIAATNVPACAACHGPAGAGLPKQFPRLAGQHADYTLAQMRTFRTGERANAPMMMAISTKMTDAEMAAVADYIQGLR